MHDIEVCAIFRLRVVTRSIKYGMVPYFTEGIKFVFEMIVSRFDHVNGLRLVFLCVYYN